MRPILETLLTIPIPFVFILILGIVFWKRRQLSFALIFFATCMLLLLSLPFIGAIISKPLLSAPTRVLEGNLPKEGIVLVPTAGIFADSNGHWWSNSVGIKRAVVGRELSYSLGIPLVLSGGSPRGEPRSESKVLAEQLKLDGPNIVLETTARNSYETAVKVAQIMSTYSSSNVILVTSPNHTARMVACLRSQGLSVSTVLISKRKPISLFSFLPSASGMGQSRNAIHEYFAILFYLLRGYINVLDLFPT